MTALQEQHERWRPANARLWGSAPKVERPPLASPPVAAVVPVAIVVTYERPLWRQIVEQVAEKHGVGFKELVGPSRRHKLCVARQEAFWRLRHEVTIGGEPMSYPKIARKLGRADHSTVHHGIKQHERRMREAGNA